MATLLETTYIWKEEVEEVHVLAEGLSKTRSTRADVITGVTFFISAPKEFLPPP